MAKGRNSEITINRILDTSLRLFLIKGYEQTTIQDIIDELGDLSKGAIYHHFKSKEDILTSVCEKLFEHNELDMQKLRDQPDKTGLEKLKDMFLASLDDPNQDKLFSFSPNLLNVPTIFVELLKDSFTVTVPQYILPIIEQGINDGSIKTDYPKELAEMIILLANYWINPLLFPMTSSELENKIKFMCKLFIGTGIEDVIEDVLNSTSMGLEKYRKLAEK